MAHSFLIFDFGGDEDAAQHARHRLDGWKQGFRLDKKLQLKFERKEKEEMETDAKSGADGNEPPKAGRSGAKGEAKAAAKSKSSGEAEPEAAVEPDKQDIRLIVRLDFSDHEKLSHQRWIERIPADELFKNANPQVIRPGEPQFKATSDLFDSLD